MSESKTEGERADLDAWRAEAGAVGALDAAATRGPWRSTWGDDEAAEVERLQALLAPTHGSLLRALASAGAARVEAAERLTRLPAHHVNVEPARLALVAAVEDEATKRAALDAFERAHGLDLTHAAAATTEQP